MTTIAHISDLHFGRIDAAAVESLVEDLHAVRPDLTVISGDLTQRARAAQFAAARQLLGRLPIPQIIVPGNHDVPLHNFFQRLTKPSGNFSKYISADEFPEFENDDVHVVGINSTSRFAMRLAGFWKDGKIRVRHLDALRAILRGPGELQGQAAGQKVRILVAHHPFIEPPLGRRHGTIHGAGRALPLLDQLGIDLILGGHLHLSYSGDLRPTYPYLKRPIYNVLAGSATSSRRREQHNAYNVLHIARGQPIELHRRALVGGQWTDAGDVRQFLRVSSNQASLPEVPG